MDTCRSRINDACLPRIQCWTMTVDRMLPSQEADDLIALTRDIADKVLDPIVDAHEKAETYPEGVFAAAGRGRTAEPAAARGVGRRRAALRGVPAGARGDRRALGSGRGRRQRAQPVVAPAAGVRHRRAEAPVAARDAVGRADRRLQPVRAAGRLRRRRAAVRGDQRGSTAATSSTARSRGSPTAASPTSTRCSPGPVRARAASPASSYPATCRA